jgi:flagellar biosynthesis protein FlhB
MGHFVASYWASAAAGLCTVLGMAVLVAPSWTRAAADFAATCWNERPLARGSSTESITGLLETAVGIMGPVVLLAGAGLAATLLGHFCQTRFGVAWRRISPDVTRLRPRRPYAAPWWNSLLRAALGAVLGCALYFAAAYCLWRLAHELPTWSGLAPESFFLRLARWAGRLAGLLGGCVAVAAIAEFGVAWLAHERSLRMTDSQVRDEWSELHASAAVGHSSPHSSHRHKEE